jgi:hypothetical protein
MKISALIAAVALLASCGSDNNFNLACGTAADCSKAQICPTQGPMQGRCTKVCSKDTDCGNLSSNPVTCVANECTPSP